MDLIVATDAAWKGYDVEQFISYVAIHLWFILFIIPKYKRKLICKRRQTAQQFVGDMYNSYSFVPTLTYNNIYLSLFCTY